MHAVFSEAPESHDLPGLGMRVDDYDSGMLHEYCNMPAERSAQMPANAPHDPRENPGLVEDRRHDAENARRRQRRPSAG